MKIFKNTDIGVTVTFDKDPTAKEAASAAEWLLNTATDIADVTGESICWDIAYGMGGYYNPKPKKMTKAEALVALRVGGPLTDEQRANIANALDDTNTDDDQWSNSDGGWTSSSEGC